MTDQQTTETLREQCVADGFLPDITFEAWCDDLRKIAAAEPNLHGPDPMDSCSSECWREYYDAGYTALDAWWVDASHD